MNARKILAKNVTALMQRAMLNSSKDVAALAKKRGVESVSNGTLGRIKRAEVSVGIDQLDRIGKLFGAEPWQLLTPGGADEWLAAFTLAREFQAYRGPDQANVFQTLVAYIRAAPHERADSLEHEPAEQARPSPTRSR